MSRCSRDRSATAPEPAFGVGHRGLTWVGSCHPAVQLPLADVIAGSTQFAYEIVTGLSGRVLLSIEARKYGLCGVRNASGWVYALLAHGGVAYSISARLIKFKTFSVGHGEYLS